MKQVQVTYGVDPGPIYTYLCADELFEKLEPDDIVVVPIRNNLGLARVDNLEQVELKRGIVYKEILGRLEI